MGQPEIRSRRSREAVSRVGTLTRSAQRRTQFSSCDDCRRSRVACDASNFGHQPGQVTWRGSCSRCTTRQRPCTFEVIYYTEFCRPRGNTIDINQWIIGPSKKSSVPKRPTQSSLTATDEEHTNAREAPGNKIELEESRLVRWSSQIFQHVFETLFGLSIDQNSCPNRAVYFARIVSEK